MTGPAPGPRAPRAESLALVSGPGAPVLTPGPGLPPTAGRAVTAGRVRAAVVRAWRHRWAARWGPPAAAAVCGGAAFLAAGAVAAAVLAAYGATGFVIVRGLAVRRSAQRAHRQAADAVVGLAADLRAGLALGPAWRAAEEAFHRAEAGVLPGWQSGRRRGAVAVDGATGPVALVAQRVVAATTLAETCGAPLADVLERLDAHLRAVDRARAVASSQAAGARVSAALLAVMPLAGVGLGILVGADPWRVLLHTPVGALALALAVALQLAGLAWAARLAETEVAL